MRMNFGCRVLFMGCLLAGLAAVPAGAQTPDKPATSLLAPMIAVVDVDQVMSESTAAKSVRGQMDKYQQAFQEEVSKDENSLRSRQQEIETQRKSLSQEAFADKVRHFDQSVAEFQRKALARRRALDKSFSQAMGQVQEAMISVTGQIASEKGVNVVLPRTQVLLFDEKMNISKEVTEALNKKLTSVEVSKPKVDVEEGAATGAQKNGGSSPAKKK